jgi:molecular chaperone GrpE
MTLTQFRQVLNKFGVTPIEALQKPFDPALHEAIGQLASDSAPPGTVVQVMQPGYLLNDRLLRPAMVLVARAPEENSSAGDAGDATQNN